MISVLLLPSFYVLEISLVDLINYIYYVCSVEFQENNMNILTHRIISLFELNALGHILRFVCYFNVAQQVKKVNPNNLKFQAIFSKHV